MEEAEVWVGSETLVFTTSFIDVLHVMDTHQHLGTNQISS